MSWGSPFATAWNAATDTAKRAAQASAETAKSAYDYVAKKSVQGYEYTKEKASQGYDYTKQKAHEAADYTKQKAHEAADYVNDKYASAKDSVRGGLRSAADTALDKGSSALDKAGRAYDKAKRALGLQKAGSPVQPCPGSTGDGGTDKSRDGMIMVPQGPGKPCLAIAPGKGALAEARAKAWKNPASPCVRKSGEAPPNILFVNGIKNTQQDHCKAINLIAKQTCSTVTGVYNATEGFVTDAKQTGDDRRLVKAASKPGAPRSVDGRNPAVDTMRSLITDEIEAGNNPELWAHSQGGAVTSLALMEARNDLAVTTGNPDPLQGVKVKSFGAAAPQWTDGPDYEHFVHVNDPVPLTLGLGDDPARDAALAGKGAKVKRFSGKASDSASYATDKLDKSLIPVNMDNHVFTDSYMKMEKQTNGGCS